MENLTKTVSLTNNYFLEHQGVKDRGVNLSKEMYLIDLIGVDHGRVLVPNLQVQLLVDATHVLVVHRSTEVVPHLDIVIIVVPKKHVPGVLRHLVSHLRRLHLISIRSNTTFFLIRTATVDPDLPLDSTNKGHQMLKNMGWSGAGGLGLKEHGITGKCSKSWFLDCINLFVRRSCIG